MSSTVLKPASRKKQEKPEENADPTNQYIYIRPEDNSQVTVALVTVRRASCGNDNATMSAISENSSFVEILKNTASEKVRGDGL